MKDLKKMEEALERIKEDFLSLLLLGIAKVVWARDKYIMKVWFFRNWPQVYNKSKVKQNEN